MKVGILMGSKSDFEVVKPAVAVLKKFGVETEVRVISAHRTPMEAHEFAASAKEQGLTDRKKPRQASACRGFLDRIVCDAAYSTKSSCFSSENSGLTGRGGVRLRGS